MNAAQRLASTLPPPPLPTLKQCKCGCVYTHEEWDELDFVGLQDDFDGGLLEMRNCICSSTICVRVVLQVSFVRVPA